MVVAPLEDSPAEKAGLKAGDIVTAIDGESVNGLALEDAVKQVRGEAGTRSRCRCCATIGRWR